MADPGGDEAVIGGDNASRDPSSSGAGAGGTGCEDHDPPDAADRGETTAVGGVLPSGLALPWFSTPTPNPFADAISSMASFKPLHKSFGAPSTSNIQRLAEQAHMARPEWLGAFDRMRAISEQHQEQQRLMLSRLLPPIKILEGLRRSFAPYDRKLTELPRLLLPPNLREASDDITAGDVLNFLEEEGIPLYLIPRASIGRRLVLSKDHASRRKVLNDRFTDIVEDCTALLEACTEPLVRDEVDFIQDGIGALKTGYFASAQAVFTLTLDSLIFRFYPDRDARRKLTNRKKGAQMPDAINDMGIRNAYVWLPIWNAHEEFWQHKGDPIPNDYSRHATVHGVSKRQFNKRNCVQSLMLSSSLVGYADQLAKAREGVKDGDEPPRDVR